MNNDVVISAYSEGQDAFIAGKPLMSIPYAKLSEKGISWMRGWHTARFGKMLSEKI